MRRGLLTRITALEREEKAAWPRVFVVMRGEPMPQDLRQHDLVVVLSREEAEKPGDTTCA